MARCRRPTSCRVCWSRRYRADDHHVWVVYVVCWHHCIQIFRSAFGSSVTHGRVHVSTTLGGLVAGNVAVIHSILAEITDDTNQDLAVPIYSLSWPVGTVIGFVSLSLVFESEWARTGSVM